MLHRLNHGCSIKWDWHLQLFIEHTFPCNADVERIITVVSHERHGILITDNSTVGWTACTGQQQRKHQRSLSLFIYPLWGKSSGDRWIPLTKSSNHDDVIEWDIFPVTGPLWGESPVTGGFPSQRPLTQSFGVFFDLRLNKRLSKQSRRRWFETPSRSLSLWRHCNGAENVPMPWHHHGVWDVYRAMPHMLAKLIIFGCIQLGLYSLSGKTTYCQISRSLEAAWLGVIMIVSLWNLTGISAAMLPRCLSSFRAIGKI